MHRVRKQSPPAASSVPSLPLLVSAAIPGRQPLCPSSLLARSLMLPAPIDQTNELINQSIDRSARSIFSRRNLQGNRTCLMNNKANVKPSTVQKMRQFSFQNASGTEQAISAIMILVGSIMNKTRVQISGI